MKTTYCTFYFVRHGESEANVQDIIQGHTSTDLSSKGREQAQELSQALKDIEFDEIFSSDILRARQTAEILNTDRKMALKTSQLIRERSYGKYENSSMEKYREELKDMIAIRDSLGLEEFRNFRVHETIETFEEIVTRFIAFIREVAVAYAGKKILVVTHGTIMKSFLIHLGFGPLDGVSIKNTGYFVLESDGTDFFVKETFNIDVEDTSKT